MEEMHNFYYANSFINFPGIYRWTCLLFTADYYLSTCCGGPFFMLAYLCRRYFGVLL